MGLFNLPKFATAAIVALAFTGVAGTASATDWTLTKATGEVTITGVAVGAQPIAATTGTLIATGQTLTTGATGRALLVHGKDIVSVGPATVLTVPRAASGDAMTVLMQTSGTTELDIEKLTEPHFAVETPYLTATVKGTHFTVTVSANDASVAVTEGRVEVTDHATADYVALLPGQSAAVDAAKRGLQVTGAPPPAVQSGKANGNNNGNGGGADNGLRASLGATAGGSGNSLAKSAAGASASVAKSSNGNGAKSTGAAAIATTSNNADTGNGGGNGNGNGNGKGGGNAVSVAQATTDSAQNALSISNDNGGGNGGSPPGLRGR